MGFQDTLIPKGDKLVTVSETDIKKLRKRLVKVEAELEKAHSIEHGLKVRTSAFAKCERKIDFLAQEKFEIKSKLEEANQNP